MVSCAVLGYASGRGAEGVLGSTESETTTMSRFPVVVPFVVGCSLSDLPCDFGSSSAAGLLSLQVAPFPPAAVSLVPGPGVVVVPFAALVLASGVVVGSVVVLPSWALVPRSEVARGFMD